MTFFPDYTFKNGRTLIVDDDGNEEDFCEEISVIRIQTDLVTKRQLVTIRIILSSGLKVRFTIPREKVAKDPISSLAAYGLTVANHHEYAVTIAEILFDTEANAVCSFCHQRLGFGKVGKKTVFFADTVLGSSVPSAHLHPLPLKAVGSFQQWRDGVIHFTGKRPELQLALAIGSCAPIAHILQTYAVLDLISVFALIGKSGTGKTSALKLMASVWGKPSTSDGIIDVLIDTQTRFFANLGQKRGFPCFIDETSAQPNWDFTSIIYNLSMGRERGRCNPDGTPKRVNRWNGAIIFTGETSLFEQTNGNAGLHARLIEFPFVWTHDGASAQKMTTFFASEYGTAYVPLVEYLLDLDREPLFQMYKDAVETLSCTFGLASSVEERLFKQYALLLLTARVIAQVWEIPMDEPAIIELLRETDRANNLRDQDDCIYDLLQEKVLANCSKFPLHADVHTAASIWGERHILNNRRCVWIGEAHFDSFLAQGGINDRRWAVDQLYAKGYIAKFGDRFKKRHPICGAKPKCYCLFLPEQTAVSIQLISKHQIPTQLQDLLSEDEDLDSSLPAAGSENKDLEV